MVIPAPARARPGRGHLHLPAGAGVRAPGGLEPVVATFLADAAADGGPELAMAPAGEQPVRVELVGRVPGEDEVPRPGGRSPSGGAPFDERYALHVGTDGVVVSAATPEGAHRGLTTLRQLIGAAPAADGGVTLDAVDLVDAPRFAWRGLSLDVVRVVLDAGDVRTVVDMLDRYKLNVLHLHLTDDEGWRFEVDGHPELTIGRPHLTRADLADLVAYAAERFVTVVPEVDLPGHSRALLAARPELGHVGEVDGVPAGYLDPARPATMPFVAEVWGQLADLCPAPFLHIGGDEAFGMPHDAYVSFVSATRDIVRDLGRTPVGWQESSGAGLGPGDLVQHWIDFAGPGGPLDQLAQATAGGDPLLPSAMLDHFRRSTGDLPRALAAGADVIVSPTTYAYFDTRHRDRSSDPASEAHRRRLGFPFYPPRRLEDLFAWDPGNVVEGLDEARVAGVEAAIWGETLDDLADVQRMICSRLPGLAERAWSPAGTGRWVEFRDRLGAQAAAWRRRGWSYLQADCVDWREGGLDVERH